MHIKREKTHNFSGSKLSWQSQYKKLISTALKKTIVIFPPASQVSCNIAHRDAFSSPDATSSESFEYVWGWAQECEWLLPDDETDSLRNRLRGQMRGGRVIRLHCLSAPLFALLLAAHACDIFCLDFRSPQHTHTCCAALWESKCEYVCPAWMVL